MPTLLHLDASPSIHTSISRSLSAAFVRSWQARHGSNGRVLRRDLALGEIARVDEAWIAAAFAPAAQRTLAQRQILAQSDQFIGELKDADEYVFGTPMYNFGVPAALKLWIDQVVRLGETYGIDGKDRHGLLANKKAHLFVASGGVYDAETPAAAVNFVDPYLRAILGYIGVTDVEVYSAGGTAVLMSKRQTHEEFLAPHLNHVLQKTR